MGTIGRFVDRSSIDEVHQGFTEILTEVLSNSSNLLMPIFTSVNYAKLSTTQLKILEYTQLMTAEKFKISVEILEFLSELLEKILESYNETYLKEEVLQNIYSDKTSEIYQNHCGVLESFECFILIFNNLTTYGHYCEELTKNGTLDHSLKLLKLVDDLGVILINLGIVPKSDDNSIPNMESADGKTSTHPLAGLKTKIVRLVGNLISQTSCAVEYFEQNMTQLGAILSHSKLDFVNVGLREHCLL